MNAERLSWVANTERALLQLQTVGCLRPAACRALAVEVSGRTSITLDASTELAVRAHIETGCPRA